jgi:hypothetical protein
MHEIGIGILIVGVVLALFGLLMRMTATSALSQPPVHDGIGGKDTNNLATGCVRLILYFFCLAGGGIFVLIGLIMVLVTK